MLGHGFNVIDEFDVVHFHVDYLHFPLSRRYPGFEGYDSSWAAGHSGSGAAISRIL
jgi:hypothetical protein